MIKVSVIVPVYNGEAHLRQCLDSIVNQTLTNIEIICVDDGSTDSSLEILNEYKARDPRFQIYTQQNLYAGVARNTGKSHATGEYLAFWDCDDYFDLAALEKMYEKALETDADVVVCGGNQFLETKDKEFPFPPYLNVKRTMDGGVFNRHTNPDYYLTFTNAAPWNKLYKRAHIEKFGLDFQPVRNGNDVYFVVCAIGLADKITTVNEKLVTYRVNAGSGLVATLSKSPTTPIDAWIAIEETLANHDGFGLRSFANKALGSMIYMLQNIAEYAAFKTAVEALKEYGLEKLHITLHEEDEEFYFKKYHRDVVKHIWNDSVEDLALFFAHEMYIQKIEAFSEKRGQGVELAAIKKERSALKNELEKTHRQNQQLENKIEDIYGSWSYKIGHALVSIPGKIKRLFKGRKN